MVSVRYILSITNVDEIVEYVGDLLQGTDGKKKVFIDELVDKWQQWQKQEEKDPERFERTGTGEYEDLWNILALFLCN